MWPGLRELSSDMVAKMYPAVALDLDGVLAEYHGWTGDATPLDPYPHTRIMMEHMVDAGYKLYVLTARRTRDLVLVDKWVYEHGFEDLLWFVTNIKHPAVAYVDDNGVRFEGNPARTFHLVQDSRPWWKPAGGRPDGPTEEQRRRLGIGGGR